LRSKTYSAQALGQFLVEKQLPPAGDVAAVGQGMPFVPPSIGRRGVVGRSFVGVKEKTAEQRRRGGEEPLDRNMGDRRAQRRVRLRIVILKESQNSITDHGPYAAAVARQGYYKLTKTKAGRPLGETVGQSSSSGENLR